MENITERNYRLLHGVARAEIARVERLASGESLVLSMIKTNAVLAEFPAEIDFLVVDDRRKIEQANVEILDDASGFENAVQRGLQMIRPVWVCSMRIAASFS